MPQKVNKIPFSQMILPGIHKISEWFASESLIESLVDKFDVSQSDVILENTSQILQAIINSHSLYTGPLISRVLPLKLILRHS